MDVHQHYNHSNHNNNHHNNNSQHYVHSGWLMKSPPEKRLWKKKWRRRWFVLKLSGQIPGQYVLEYYVDQNCKKLKGTIDLDQCEQVDAGLELEIRKENYEFMFDVRTPKRVFYLVAATEDDMNRWVECICSVCGLKIEAVPVNSELSLLPPVSIGGNSPGSSGGGASPGSGSGSGSGTGSGLIHSNSTITTTTTASTAVGLVQERYSPQPSQTDSIGPMQTAPTPPQQNSSPQTQSTISPITQSNPNNNANNRTNILAEHALNYIPISECYTGNKAEFTDGIVECSSSSPSSSSPPPRPPKPRALQLAGKSQSSLALWPSIGGDCATPGQIQQQQQQQRLSSSPTSQSSHLNNHLVQQQQHRTRLHPRQQQQAQQQLGWQAHHTLDTRRNAARKAASSASAAAAAAVAFPTDQQHHHHNNNNLIVSNQRPLYLNHSPPPPISSSSTGGGGSSSSSSSHQYEFCNANVGGIVVVNQSGNGFEMPPLVNRDLKPHRRNAPGRSSLDSTSSSPFGSESSRHTLPRPPPSYVLRGGDSRKSFNQNHNSVNFFGGGHHGSGDKTNKLPLSSYFAAAAAAAAAASQHKTAATAAAAAATTNGNTEIQYLDLDLESNSESTNSQSPRTPFGAANTGAEFGGNCQDASGSIGAAITTTAITNPASTITAAAWNGNNNSSSHANISANNTTGFGGDILGRNFGVLSPNNNNNNNNNVAMPNANHANGGNGLSSHCSSNNSSTVYKKVDFVKTQLLNKMRSERDMNQYRNGQPTQ